MGLGLPSPAFMDAHSPCVTTAPPYPEQRHHSMGASLDGLFATETQPSPALSFCGLVLSPSYAIAIANPDQDVFFRVWSLVPLLPLRAGHSMPNDLATPRQTTMLHPVLPIYLRPSTHPSLVLPCRALDGPSAVPGPGIQCACSVLRLVSP